MRLIDSHTHLDFSQFDDDREAVIQRARDAGLVAVLNVGIDLPTSRAAVALAREVAFVYAAVGIHPHQAKTFTVDALDALRALAKEPKVVAIGEIGLDYYRDYSPRAVQREAFSQQLALAAELDMPVVVHSREAHDDVLTTLRDGQGRGVLHSYSAGPGRLDDVLGLGFSIGLSGPVTFPTATRLREVAARVNLERLLIETYCPFLTPEPHRGQRNEPAYVRYVAEAVAGARGVPVEKIARATAENAARLFGIL